ncbi:hypothetical protein OC834_007918, partial [Tilletia horrida]
MDLSQHVNPADFTRAQHLLTHSLASLRSANEAAIKLDQAETAFQRARIEAEEHEHAAHEADDVAQRAEQVAAEATRRASELRALARDSSTQLAAAREQTAQRAAEVELWRREYGQWLNETRTT